jgi:acyl-CoA dehydrogenase
MSALAGGVFDTAIPDDESADLRRLVADIGQRSFDAKIGHRGLPEQFDDALWRNLEETGLSRLTSTPDLGAGPTESAILLSGLARYAAAVPIAETDVLAAWLGAQVGVELPDTGPLTVALADADVDNGRITGAATDVPWARAAGAIVLSVRVPDGVFVGLLDAPDPHDAHNLAGEPRSTVTFDVAVDDLVRLNHAVGEELSLRGAWSRCVQIIGALDAAAELTVAHTRERTQFGRSLSKFQAVQHALASMAGEIERARAATNLAVAAAADHGFDSPQTNYAVTIAKVTLGRVVGSVTAIAHQLHGAIGVTIEHQLWLATTRAQSWIDEFGSTHLYATRSGRAAMSATNPWSALIGDDLRAWS